MKFQKQTRNGFQLISILTAPKTQGVLLFFLSGPILSRQKNNSGGFQK